MLDDIDWSLTTWTGSRRRQHRDFYALPLAVKLAALEEMEELARALGTLPRSEGSQPVLRVSEPAPDRGDPPQR